MATKIPSPLPLPLLLLLVAVKSFPAVHAHAHHDDVSEEQLHASIDAILYLHMGLQALVWGVLFPIGMVLGLSRSRWHVPLQVSFPPASPIWTPL